MRRFTQLFLELDSSTRTTQKVSALARYFREAPAEDAAWALWFLSGHRFKGLVKSKSLRGWASDLSGLPRWLVEESYTVVGDLAETLALLSPPTISGTDKPLHAVVEEWIQPLQFWDDNMNYPLLQEYWTQMDADQRFVFNKLITGGFRVGVSRTLVVRALAQVAEVEQAVMEHRLSGSWQPNAETFQRFLSTEDTNDPARPYPFYLASPVDDLTALGERSQWQVEDKWDGIRAQLIHREGAQLLWSRGEEMVAEQFPEVQQAANALPLGSVLDGEVLAWKDDRVQPFATLQKRLGRKDFSGDILTEAPVTFLAYDILEHDGRDLREEPLQKRRNLLEGIVQNLPQGSAIRLSPLVTAESWETLQAYWQGSRSRGTEGLMLKRRDSVYKVGRVKGDWWKWKIDPLTLDVVMIYAQAGHGRRANLFTDYTFAVWKEDELVPIAKAYSGLTDEEIRQVDRWVKRNTLSRHGPVRIVKPELVFEVAFEGIQESTRHKSGLALRFPRISRQRTDKKPEDADTLETARKLL